MPGKRLRRPRRLASDLPDFREIDAGLFGIWRYLNDGFQFGTVTTGATVTLDKIKSINYLVFAFPRELSGSDAPHVTQATGSFHVTASNTVLFNYFVVGTG